MKLKFKLSNLWKDRRQTRADGGKPHAVKDGRGQHASERQDQQLTVEEVLPPPALENNQDTGAVPDAGMAALLNLKLPPLPNAA